MELTCIKRLIFFAFFYTFLISVYGGEKSLYTDKDHILELDANNFNANVYGQKKAFLIEFYSSWCGACIAYAPEYKKFALRVKSWSPLVQVGAVNCAEDMNSKLCRENGIEAFPTLKYFKYSPASKDDGKFFKGDSHDIDRLPLEIASLAHDDWSKYQPSGWPNFDFVDDGASLDGLWQQAGNASLVALVVGSHPAKMAWAEMINYARDKRIAVFSTTPSHIEAQKLAAGSSVVLPKAYLFRNKEPVPVYISNDNSLYHEIAEKISEQLGFEPEPNGPDSLISEVQPTAPVTWSQFEVQMVDIMSAMYHMLKEEIPRKKFIDGEKLSALKMWIRMLKKFAPGTTPIRRLFYRLDEWLQTQVDSITSDQWVGKVDNIQAELGNPLPSNMTWMACRGSKPYLRGYTCGLWTLMHVMTVSAHNFEYSNPVFNVLNEIVEPIHQFIWRFLSCEICGKHFHIYYTKTDFSSFKKAEHGILWLWKAHNIANKVLAKQPSDDPAFPKQQFPSATLCPSCWSDGKFVESEVLNFLVTYYSNIRSDGVQPAPAYVLTEFRNGEVVQESAKRLNPKFAVGFENVDRMEQSENRRRRQLDASPQRKWKNIDSSEYGRSYDPSSGIRTFYLLWLAIGVVAVIIVYMQYSRNRSKLWKTFYYYNDYKL